MNKQEYTGLEIAVVGMACKFPGASNINEFWENLKNGKESLSIFSDEELREYGIEEKEFSDPNYIRAKGLIDGAEFFDASFFGISPSEADVLDPQFRILLQCAYNSLEDSGYSFAEKDNNTGVFVGGAPNFNWQMQCFKKISNLHSEQFSSLIANDKDFISTRLSYLLNLQGHSQTVYTACSTSLVAIDMACQSLLTGKCDVTLAGGVSLSLPYKSGYKSESGMFTSKDGHTRSYDMNATGTIWSDGVGTVVLKRLEDAIEDGDNIHAVIKGSATNNDGNRKIGYTAPSVMGQSAVIKKALIMAEVPEESITYIEGHGSATALGDKIEINALKEVFKDTRKDFSCSIGSVKSNFGHLNVAAGVAGFIKACLMLKNETIPPSLHFETPNSQLKEANGTFFVNNNVAKWENSKFPLRAGVNSFGIGGTNAHVILEKAPNFENTKTKTKKEHSIICLSANTPTVLNALSDNLSNYIKNNRQIDIANLAYTLQVGREHLKYRKAFVAKDVDELIEELGKNQKAQERTEFPEVVFMFPGMGGFYSKMGNDLYLKENVFKNAMDTCFSIIKSKTGNDFKTMMYGDNPQEIPNDFQTPQLMVFAFEYSLSILLKSWGIVSDTTIGYSLGEYVAACIAGVFSLNDVLEILIERGRLINTLDTGGMYAIPLPKKEVEPYLKEGVSIAIDNGDSVVVAGRKNILENLINNLKDKDVLVLDILDKYAVHTSEMDPIAEEFKNILTEYSINTPELPMVSNVTGDWCSEEFVSPEYWIKHLAKTVDFSKVVNTLLNKNSDAIYLEMGVGKFMGILLSRSISSEKTLRHVSLSRSENRIKNDNEQVSDHTHLLKAIASFWEYGGEINWDALQGDEKRSKLSLPTYPFAGLAYNLQIDSSFSKINSSNDLARQEDLSSWFYVPSWKKKPIISDNDKEGHKSRNILLLKYNDSEGLYNILLQDGHNVIRANYSNTYKKTSKNCYLLDYNKKEHVLKLLESLESENTVLDSILDLSSITDTEENISLERIVTLIQSINETKYADKKLEYLTVSSDLFKIYGNEEINPGKSGIISAIKVIPQENQNINCRLIEIEGNTDQNKNAGFYKFLNEELNSSDSVVSYRGKYRWTQIYEPYPIHIPEKENSYIKDTGTYIILGGLGDVGYTIAQYITENFKSNVVIVGRSKIPEREDRKEWIEAHPTNDPISKKIARLDTLDTGKGNVVVVQGDSTSYDSMKDVIAEVKSKFGQVDGIFHAAGDVGRMSLNLINNIGKEELNTHLSSKIKGLSILQKIVKNNSFDFSVIVSSTSSILGGIGMIGYAAANQYVDSLVTKENDEESETKWMSLNYTYLNKEKEDIQGVQNTDQEEGRKVFEKLFSKNSDTTNTAIDFEESKKIFERLLAKGNDEDQIIVSPINFSSLVEKLKNTVGELENEESEIKEKGERPNVDAPYVTPVTDSEKKLAEIWEGVFGFEVGLKDDFFQLGGDSLGIIKLISSIQKVFDVSIEISEVFKDTSFGRQLNLIEKGSKREVIEIVKAPKKEYYMQSEVQKGFFILNQMNPDLLCYNNLGIITFEGAVDFKVCEKLFQGLVQEHDVLRTSFHVVDGKAVQKIHEKVDFNLQLFENENEEIEEIVRRFHQPFDLEQPKLIRAGICKRKNNTFCIITDIHHIVLDRVTFGLIIEDFQSLYNNKELVPSTIKYVDFSEWQQSKDFEKLLIKQEEFWFNEYKNIPDSLTLPTDFPRSVVKNYNASSVIFELSNEENSKLQKICQDEKITMYTLMLSMYYVLLSKLSNQEDIVVGTTVLGRQYESLEKMLGAFANTLPIRSRPIQSYGFREFLHKVKNDAFQCFANQEYPFEKLVKKLDLKPNLYQNPLFDVMFEYYNFPEPKMEVLNSRLLEIELPNVTSEFDFCMRISSKEDEGHIFNLDYRTDLYKKETIERFVGYFRNIVKSVTNNIEIKLSELDFLPEVEQKELLQDYNATSLNYSDKESLVSLFERQVTLNPEAVAATYQEASLTYKELNEYSNQVAHYLVSKGIVPGTTVGLLLDRSLDMLIGILGVLKSGAGYLPLDTELPEHRIGYMLDKSHSSFLLTNDQYLEQYTAYLPVQKIDSLEIKDQKMTNLSIDLSSDDLAYCIFTSGSSGKPKGVMMNQRSVVNLVKGLEEFVYKTYGDKKIRVALLASFSFDASIQQIFGSLLQGHSLYIVDEESRKDGTKLCSFYNANAIDLSDGTPTHLRIFINALGKGDSLDSLSSWILAGEVLSKKLVEKFRSLFGEQVQLYNFYGPTESCVDSTAYKIDWNAIESYDSIPIGKPLPNERVYVTDSHGNLLPKGVVGELCIAGDGLAQRYAGDESLTSEKFDSEWIAWEDRVYRTGDLVKWLPDGNLAYKGRIDDQVKVRGYRIELSEIMHQLDSHSGINHSVVVLREHAGEQHLIAYYESTSELKVKDIRGYLEQLLPSYMIPSYYVHMDQLPLTINGKVDRNLLPDFEVKQQDNYLAPSTDTEQELIKIWSEVLNVEEDFIGIQTNFLDLGGNSLSLVFLKNKILETFNVSLMLKDLILLKDVEQQSKAIDNSSKEEYSNIPIVSKRAYYPLSSSQKRLYFLNNFDEDSIAYNQPQCFVLKGILDTEKLTKVFQQVIARHESLRTRFELQDGEPVQYIAENVPFEFEYFRSSMKKSGAIISEFVRPFDLEKAPLLRVGLIRISKEKHIMMFDIHHIISDGISIGIFIKDLMAFYQDQTLTPLELQYKDYAVWQQNEEQKRGFENHKQFWTEMFSELPPVLELPTDRIRPKIINYRGNLFEFTLNSKQTKGLNALAKTSGTTMFSVILAAYKVLIYKLTGQKDLIVGTSVAGRNHSDIENVMGVFLNSLPLRNDIRDNDSFNKLLLRINENSLSSFEHQNYPYEELIDDLNIIRDTARNPLFDVMFEYANFEQPEPVFSGLELIPYPYEYNVSKFDLTLHANEKEDHIALDFQYSTDLFDRSTVENFVTYFIRIIDQVTSDEDIRIDTIGLMETAELDELKKLNSSELSFEIDQDIVSLFESNVSRNPERTAVVFEGVELSYKELNEQSNQIANYLRQQKIEKGDIVGLILDRSIDMIAGILGVLKSGGAYLPIDPKLPFERVNYLLESSSTRLLVGHKRHLDNYKNVIDVHDIKNVFSQTKNNENLQIDRSLSDLAYCIYTSGSTGTPKGVLVEHSNVMNLVGGLSRTVYEGFEPGLHVGLLASYSFDASCQQIFGALLQGHSLYISSEEQRMDGLELYSFYKENRIAISDGTPTHFGMFLSSFSGEIDLPDLKRWLLAGEALNKELVRDFYERLKEDNDLKLYNLYGPTETCVDSTYFCIDPLQLDNYTTIPIGGPLPNERIYVVDSSGNPVPQGVLGELCIAGSGLARGYVDKKNEKERFVTDWIVGEKRVYRTGDLACWLPDGNLEYRGRMDSQVKLRGYRIELGEIEHNMLSHPAITGAAVVLKTVEKETYLTAYYVSEQDFEGNQLREYLLDILPEYMAPSFCVRLDDLPVTSNGKLNRGALPNPNTLETNSYKAPSTENEERLLIIWSEVLKRDPKEISVAHNFLELGGHSLKAIQIANMIKKDFGVDIKLAEIFQRTTIQEQARFIDANQWLHDEEIQESDKLEINI